MRFPVMAQPSPQPMGVEGIITGILDPATWHGALIYAVVILVAGKIATRILRGAVSRLIERDRRIDRTVALFLTQVGQVVIWVLALAVFIHVVPALQKFGTTLLAGVSIVSVVIGLAAQSTLSNFIAGISLLLYRPFHLDDILQITTPTGVETGVVERLNLGYTMLRTLDGRRIMVPNSTMATQVTLSINHAKLAALAVVPIAVLDVTYLDRVRARLYELVQHDPDVIGMARCQETTLASGGVVLSFRIWSRTQDAAERLRRDLSNRIIEAFPRAVIAPSDITPKPAALSESGTAAPASSPERARTH